MMISNEDFSILFHRFFFPPGPAGPLAFSVFIPDARIISISSNLSVVIKIRMRMIMKMMRMIMKMKTHLKAEISFLISLTSSSVTPSFSAFRCS